MLDNNRIVNASLNTGVTSTVKSAVYEARSGERVRVNGVFGEYYLGEYTGYPLVLSVGDIFPDRQVGVTFCLHEEF
ncbi:MAG: hypothetical protein K0R99_3775 [Microbacterium sp.]|jgi:hypothetical protein|uniref:hypothetical protein n=1 Tax=Microbacterium sp. TaxID=51671 RepID=UPI0026265D08|nr:hypothetical protein [Microbacterium sp.]MDF2562329.1 hypothetical protein [Microbacterium sp.]